MSAKNESLEHELNFHIQKVLKGERRFETAAQAISRMILEKPVTEIVHAGETTYDYEFFREGKKHIVGWHNEINQFVHFVKDAAEGGSAKELAIVFVGEPGNGKTFFIDYICNKYRLFLSKPENRRYTFKFVKLDEVLGYDKRVAEMASSTYEDPMILAMNIFGNETDNKKFLKELGFSDDNLELFYAKRRSLGASTEYLWYELMEHYERDAKEALKHIQVIPVPMMESLGTTTGKYSAKDKITSSSVDLLGEESLQHLLLLNPGDPNKFDLRRGALARVAGGGIHFSDEMFRNKKDLVQIYLQVIQNRNIELDGFVWPIDAMVIGTSNNDAYNEFISEKGEAPIKDRCKIVYVSHNTDYKLQHELTNYCTGSCKKTTILGEPMHQDPNLIFAASISAVLTRLLHSDKLNPIQTMKLEAGEIAGEVGVKSLVEIKEEASKNPDVTKRWGQKGLGHRDLGRVFQELEAMAESNKGKCLFAKDVFKAVERIILDYVSEAVDRTKYFEDLKIARKLYRERIKTSIFNAFRDDPEAIRKDVMLYVNMIIGIDAKNLGPDKTWRYKDPRSGEIKPLKIEERFINSVEDRMGLNNRERKEAFRTTIRKIYGQKIPTDPNYDFMDQEDLVKAVTDVRLESDVAGAGSLIGALANRTNEENVKLFNRMINTMMEKLGYCPTCAAKTIEYYCEKEDES
jgi:serine protein kinase